MASAAEEAKAAAELANEAANEAAESKAAYDARIAELDAKLAELSEREKALDAKQAELDASPTAEVGQVELGRSEPALVKRLVLSDGVSIAKDADGKKVQRYDRGQTAEVRPENVEYLESIYAIAKESYDPKMGYPTVLQQVLAANRTNQAAPAELVNIGAVEQAEESEVDVVKNGGDGSTDNSPPNSQQDADRQNAQL